MADKSQPASGSVRRLAPPADGPCAGSLAAAVVAFNRGDFGAARGYARAVWRDAGTEAERAFAAELLRRTGVDPVALVLGALAACACAWAVLQVWAS